MKFLDRPGLPALLLRVALAFAFLYASVSSFLSPNDWVGYFPAIMRSIVPGTVLLPIFSGIELFVAILLLVGWYTRYVALFAAVMLAGIVVANPALLSVTFRDVSLVIAALALFVLDYQTTR